MPPMTTLQHLTLWKIDHDLIEDYEARYKTVHGFNDTESDPTLCMLAILFQHRTDALALQLNAGPWLDWFCWDNDMGRKGHSVAIPGHFKRGPVRSLKTLATLIKAHALANP